LKGAFGLEGNRHQRRKIGKKQIGIAAVVSLWAVNVLMQMLRIRVLLYAYGTEVNGVIQTADQVSAYFVIFEGGLRNAYLYRMYAPMREKRYRKIASLFRGLSISLKRISRRMIVALVPVAIIGAFAIAQQDVGKLNTALIIALCGIRFIIPYYFNLSCKILLNVHNYQYVVDTLDTSASVLIMLVEIALAYNGRSILAVLCVGIILNLALRAAYRLCIKKLCAPGCLSPEKPDFRAEKMMKDVLAHQISGLINNNVDTILLSVVDVALVTVYQGYMQAANSVIALVNRISNNYRAVVGIRLSDRERDSYMDFQAVLSFHMFVAICALSVYIACIDDFVSLWIGSEYAVGGPVTYAVAAYLMLRMMNNPVNIIFEGSGLYGETKKYAMLEVAANLSLSVILLKIGGIVGIIGATAMSYGAVSVPGYTHVIYRKVFERPNTFFLNYALVAAGVAVATWVYGFFSGQAGVQSWIGLALEAVGQGAAAVLVSLAILIPCKGKYWKTMRR